MQQHYSIKIIVTFIAYGKKGQLFQFSISSTFVASSLGVSSVLISIMNNHLRSSAIWTSELSGFDNAQNPRLKI